MLYSYMNRETGEPLFHCLAFDLSQANRKCMKALEEDFGSFEAEGFPTLTWSAVPLNLKQAVEGERSYFFHPIGDGKVVYEPPTDIDFGLNEVTREKIAAFSRHHGGGCFMGNINRYRSIDEGKPYLVEYTGQLVCNFEHRFIIPTEDQALVRLIRAREEAPYTGTADDRVLINGIFDRIEQLGGMMLNWV